MSKKKKGGVKGTIPKPVTPKGMPRAAFVAFCEKLKEKLTQLKAAYTKAVMDALLDAKDELKQLRPLQVEELWSKYLAGLVKKKYLIKVWSHACNGMPLHVVTNTAIDVEAWNSFPVDIRETFWRDGEFLTWKKGKSGFEKSSQMSPEMTQRAFYLNNAQLGARPIDEQKVWVKPKTVNYSDLEDVRIDPDNPEVIILKFKGLKRITLVPMTRAELDDMYHRAATLLNAAAPKKGKKKTA
jgi:hypothetical protein